MLSTRTMRMLLLSTGIALTSACTTQQKTIDLTPNLPKGVHDLPSMVTKPDYWRVMADVREERDACYDDLARIQKSFNKLNKRWYQFWK